MRQSIDMKEALVNSVIHVVAKDGLEKTTTKLIANDAKLNEAYIYRCFENKVDLLRTTFKLEDEAFVAFLTEKFEIIKTTGLSWKERCALLWKEIWNYLLARPNDCKFYVRYYYSASFHKYAVNDHASCFAPVVDCVSEICVPGTDVNNLVRYILESAVSYALHVIDGDIENDDDACNWMFEQFYLVLTANVSPEYKENVL